MPSAYHNNTTLRRHLTTSQHCSGVDVIQSMTLPVLVSTVRLYSGGRTTFPRFWSGTEISKDNSQTAVWSKARCHDILVEASLPPYHFILL